MSASRHQVHDDLLDQIAEDERAEIVRALSADWPDVLRSLDRGRDDDTLC
jgi:hypothetical protein